jgi:hypothetical protein
MTSPVENCPVEEKPMRDRAYTDQQLLELAAKAAGLGDGPYDFNSNTGWNPLVSNGDALWLAVKLRINLEMDETYVFGLRTRYSESGMCECWNNDPCAAARRAIVRAAAAIAEGAKS